jgi:hypothetical protein
VTGRTYVRGADFVDSGLVRDPGPVAAAPGNGSR